MNAPAGCPAWCDGRHHEAAPGVHITRRNTASWLSLSLAQAPGWEPGLYFGGVRTEPGDAGLLASAMRLLGHDDIAAAVEELAELIREARQGLQGVSEDREADAGYRREQRAGSAANPGLHTPPDVAAGADPLAIPANRIGEPAPPSCRWCGTTEGPFAKFGELPEGGDRLFCADVGACYTRLPVHSTAAEREPRTCDRCGKNPVRLDTVPETSGAR